MESCFREKYRGKSPLHAQLPQQHLASFKPKEIGSSVQDAILAKVSIYHGSIVDDELVEDMDAVVNPANERLWADGSGVCGAIFREAGYDKLQKECDVITEKCDNNRIPTGQTVITPGFELNTAYILHTIAPCEQNNEDLISCYISALELCVINGIRSVAFPCIGTGDGNFSKAAACSIALRSVRGWLSDAVSVKYKDFMQKVETKEWQKNHNEQKAQKKNDNNIYIDDEETVYDRISNVVFCCFDQENWELYKDIITKIYPSSKNDNKQNIKGRVMKGIEKIYIDLNEKMQQFKQKYTKQKILEIVEQRPQKLFCDVISSLNYLRKIKETTDCFIKYVENINLFISKVMTPKTETYTQWNVDEMILWIMSKQNGKFADCDISKNKELFEKSQSRLQAIWSQKKKTPNIKLNANATPFYPNNMIPSLSHKLRNDTTLNVNAKSFNPNNKTSPLSQKKCVKAVFIPVLDTIYEE